jgi:cation diffusion facilitator CzcD-associated flavoprotein CzcO
MLVPTGYPLGTKRPSLESGYYAAFNRDDVELVDVREDPVVEVVAEGIRTTSGLHEVDTIIFATGFDTLTGAISRIELRGRDGLLLSQKWAEGPQTFLGLGIHGFPNLFLVAGPGSPGLLSNVITSIEHHIDWLADLLLHAQERHASVIEASQEAEREWRAHCEDVAGKTLYPLADNAYTGANIEGKPRALLPYVGGVGQYRLRLDEVVAAGYAGFELA